MSLYFSLFGVVFIIHVIRKVLKNQFSEGKSLFWIIGGGFVLLLSIFPKIIDLVALKFGIAYPPSLLFLTSILFIMVIIFRQEQELSLQSERLKELAQRNALLENQINNLTPSANKQPQKSDL